MKKILKDLAIFCILAIIIAGIILPRELNNLDEIWNFNFARNIANGLMPYRDFNMVQTPLLSIICGMILKAFGTELFTMRIIAVVLCSSIMLVAYKILEKLETPTALRYAFLIATIYLYKNYFCIDYNFAVLLIILIITLLELKNIEKHSSKLSFFSGILVGMAILTKQTTGIFLSLVFLLYNILIINNKDKLKEYGKETIYKTLGIIVPIILFCIYITICKGWNDFIDYTILGIKTFSNKISYINLLNGNYGKIISILSLLIPILLLGIYVKTVVFSNKNKDKSIYILFAYSIASLIVVYPISDSIHFLIGIFPSLILLVYFLWSSLKNKVPKNKLTIFGKYFLKCALILIVIVNIYISVKELAKYKKETNTYKELQNFKYIKAESDRIQIIDQFIIETERNNKNVYILDATAPIYMIPIDKYNKDYDMFLKGNLGRKRRARAD